MATSKNGNADNKNPSRETEKNNTDVSEIKIRTLGQLIRGRKFPLCFIPLKIVRVPVRIKPIIKTWGKNDGPVPSPSSMPAYCALVVSSNKRIPIMIIVEPLIILLVPSFIDPVFLSQYRQNLLPYRCHILWSCSGKRKSRYPWLFRAWSQPGPPVTIGGPTGSGYVVLEAAFFSRLFVFDKCICIKKILSKSVNNASLTPPQSGPCCDQARFFVS